MTLPEITFDVSAAAFDRDLSAFRRGVEHELEVAVLRAGRAIAKQARQVHNYDDHTRTLTGSIDALTPTGSALAGTLEGGAEATAEYASYIEDGTKHEDGTRRIEPRRYMAAAHDTITAPGMELDTEIADALERAVVRGWL